MYEPKNSQKASKWYFLSYIMTYSDKSQNLDTNHLWKILKNHNYYEAKKENCLYNYLQNPRILNNSCILFGKHHAMHYFLQIFADGTR